MTKTEHGFPLLSIICAMGHLSVDEQLSYCGWQEEKSRKDVVLGQDMYLHKMNYMS